MENPAQTVPSTAQRVRVLTIVWAAMTASVVIYWVLGGWVIKTMSWAVPWPSSATMILVGFAVLCLMGGILWLRSAVAAAERRTLPTMLQQLTLMEQSIIHIRLQFTFLMSLASLEMPAILGLINRMADTAHPWVLQALAVSSLGAMAYVRAWTLPAIVHLLNRLGTAQPPVR